MIAVVAIGMSGLQDPQLEVVAIEAPSVAVLDESKKSANSSRSPSLKHRSAVVSNSARQRSRSVFSYSRSITVSAWPKTGPICRIWTRSHHGYRSVSIWVAFEVLGAHARS